MTVPTIVITVEGGVVQHVATSHQARVIIVDYDVAPSEPNAEIDGSPAHVAVLNNLPNEESDAWIAEVLKALP